MQKIINTEVEKMLEEGVIQPSNSPWSAPVVITKKKNGQHRFCIDLRRLNKVSKKDAYPLPQANATLDKLRGAKYIFTIDLKNGYWEVALTEESRAPTAFTVAGKGLFEFTVMWFGLHAAPATFQRLLDHVMTAEMAPHVFAYLDDIVIVADTYERHMEILTNVLDRLHEAKLRPNWEKCYFACKRLRYMGYIVDENGLQTDPEKVSAVTELKEPQDAKQLRRFLGFASWYRRFIKDTARLASPLNKPLTKKRKWEWGKAQQAAFD